MVYRKGIVAAIKVAGKILRERGDEVELPFGSEYSILLKNQNAVRVMAKVEIDGQDATEGTWLVIAPNGKLEIERFIRNGNLKQGNRFKFIERTKAVEDSRGIEIEDALIRIEYKVEKKAPIINHQYTYTHHYHDWPYYSPCRPVDWPYYSPCRPVDWTLYNQNFTSSSLGGSPVRLTGMRSSQGDLGAINSAQGNVSYCNSTTDIFKYTQEKQNEAGITVPGSQSDQQFHPVQWFDTEASEALTIHLRGRHGVAEVKKPLTVEKLTCSVCHLKTSSRFEFCGRCGASLRLL